MQLTGKEIIEQGVVTNYDPASGIQQQGVDLRVKNISVVYGPGHVWNERKTTPAKTKPINLNDDVILLPPGYYELELMEGCAIPDNIAAYIKTRSSLIRCGAIIHSGQFDGGFHTDNMGCFLQVLCPVYIEIGSRVGQLICHTSSAVENTYNGQWQNDVQRKRNNKE